MKFLEKLSVRRLKMLGIQAREGGNHDLLAMLAVERARRAVEKMLREVR